MNGNQKEALRKVAAQMGFVCPNTASLIATIAIKVVNLLLGILFLVLRGKAKAAGKKGKKTLFTVLAAICLVGAVTSNARIHKSGDECEACDDDFVKDDDCECKPAEACCENAS